LIKLAGFPKPLGDWSVLMTSFFYFNINKDIKKIRAEDIPLIDAW
jgi:hypothetical protein